MAKKKDVSLEELTQFEFYKIETEEKIAGLEKEIVKNKKNIANLKRKDRLYSKAISLCENKMTTVKDNSLKSLLFLCEKIKEIKDSYNKNLEKINNDGDLLEEGYEKLAKFYDEYDYILSAIYKVCNKIEEDSVFTKDDRNIISTGFEMSDLAENENFDSFNELTKELRKSILKKTVSDVKSGNIASEDEEDDEKVSLKSGKNLDKFEFDDDTDISEEQHETSQLVYDKEYYSDIEEMNEKFNKIFYEAPKDNKKVVSNIEATENFDFNEALNPTLSLSDIMSDLMGNNDLDDDLDGLLSFPKKSAKNAKSDSKKSQDDEEFEEDDEEDLISKREQEFKEFENKIDRPEKIERREDNRPKKYSSGDKLDYEKRFTFIQNIVKDNK